jgi:hypothetical protein
MSDLDFAIWQRIVQIVYDEHRPFSFIDFVPTFEVDGKCYSISPGTLRNKFSKMLKTEKIEVAYYSSQAFYTIKGIRFDKSESEDHIGVGLPLPLRYIKNDPIYRSIQGLRFAQRALHNIRLRLEVRGIWSLLSSHSGYIPNPKSKDLTLESITINELVINVIVRRTDTISVMVGCSYCPVAIDATGVLRLSTALMTLREMLCKVVKECSGGSELENMIIPDQASWLVTMWHFGADALNIFAGEKYYRRWEIAEKILFTIYVKEWQERKRRIRWDCQEYPNQPIALALEEKLNANRRN